ncbi:MAG: GAF domain-containing protein [Chloroflexales bacterium]
MTSSPVRNLRRTHTRWKARAADLARRLSESKRRYAALANESRHQTEALARLDEVRSMIGRENTVDMILRVATESIAGTFGYPSVSIYLLEDGALVLMHGIGHTPPAARILSHSLPLGHVANTGEPLMITDTRMWPERLDLGPGVASVISAPLRVGGQVAGVVHIESSQPDALGTDDLSWLLTLSDHLGKAVERTRLRGDLQRTVRETLTLNRMMSVIASAKDTRESLQTICADLADAFGVPQVLCALLNADRSAQTVVAEYRDADGPSVIGTVIPVRGNLLTQDLIARRQPVALSNLPMNPHPGSSSRRKGNAVGRVSLLAVPVLIHDQVIGMIGLSSAESHVFTPDDIALAQRLSTTIGQILTNLRLHAAIRQELTEFLDTTRHEIRAPVHRVIGAVEQLLDTPLSEEQRAYVKTIQTNGEATLTMMNKIFDLAKIEPGAP